MKYYGYIYKVTDLVNPHNLPNPFYTGKRKGEFDPNYYGSGLLITRAVKKRGTKDFKVELIECVLDKETHNEQEKFWIKGNDCIWPKGYNLAKGGEGGIGNGGCLKGRPLNHKSTCQCCVCKAKRQEPHKVGCKCITCRLKKRDFISEETLTKNRGRIWIYTSDSKIHKRVKPEELQKYLGSGYIVGKLSAKRGKARKPYKKHKFDCTCISCTGHKNRLLREQKEINICVH